MEWVGPSARILAASGFTVVNFDYRVPPGWVGETQERTALAQIADVLSVMDAADVEMAHVIGLSRGAITAYGLAAQTPDRVVSLTLAFPVSGHADTLYAEAPNSDPDGLDASEYLTRVVETVFSPEYLEHGFDEAQSLLTTPPGSVDRVERSEEEPFPTDWSASCPILIIEGGADQVVDPRHTARYRQAHPEADSVLVPGASHGWLMEQPSAFADLVMTFLRHH
jgi:pimeloyl-ACP methyl ester carboxylesterase